MTKESIAVLLTVHNRKEKTLKCLESLFNQQNINVYSVDIYLTDDGSTDGTSEAIKVLYPTVKIIQGNGHLFWTKGMWTAWRVAEEKKEYDYICWLNDDVILFKNALEHILDCCNEKDNKAIISGIMCDSIECGKTTYSGTKNKMLIERNGSMQEIEHLHGNFVLVPQCVYKTIGIIDNYYSHSGGDTDYSMTAIKNGINVYTTKNYCGICKLDFYTPKCFDKDIPLIKRIKILYTPLSYAMPKDIFHLYYKNGNICHAILSIISIHLRCISPTLYNKLKRMNSILI